MELLLTNRQIIEPELKTSLSLLSAKALPAKIAATVADLAEFIEEKTIKIEVLQTDILLKCGAVPIPGGHKIERDNPLFDVCIKEREALLDIRFRFCFEPIILPEFDFTGKPLLIEPVILKGLKSFLPARQKAVYELPE